MLQLQPHGGFEMGNGFFRYRSMTAKDHRKAMLFSAICFASAGLFKLVSVFTHQSGLIGVTLAIPMFGFAAYFFISSRQPVQDQPSS